MGSGKEKETKNFVRDPLELLKQPECKAITLSVSDNHANLLVWRRILEREDKNHLVYTGDEHSIIKITVIPGHKERLQMQKKITSIDELENTKKETNDNTSKQILQFLGKLDYHLTSESGAEYSYYTATEKSWWTSPYSIMCNAFGWNESAGTSTTKFKVELISPASRRQIERSLPIPALSLVEETPEMYKTIVEPFIQSVVESGSLSWIENVIEGKKETERLLFTNSEFVINVDTKWKSHPDANFVPRKQWYQHTSVEDLYCLAIVKDGTIRSLRDLRQKHVPMLKSIIKEGRKTIEEVYGVNSDQLRIFVHYQPQFYHFHVHFTRLENETGCQVERGHLVRDIIQNLELDSEYYAKRTITYKVKMTSDIYFKIENAD